MSKIPKFQMTFWFSELLVYSQPWTVKNEGYINVFHDTPPPLNVVKCATNVFLEISADTPLQELEKNAKFTNMSLALLGTKHCTKDTGHS